MAAVSLKKNFLRQGRLLLVTVLIGVSAGIAAVLFRMGAEGLTALVITGPSQWPWWAFALTAPVVMITGAAITGWLMARYAPDAAGSGIPQVKLAYHHEQYAFSYRLLLVKFFGGILSIGTGSSMGREGPTIHIGAAIASKLAARFGESKEATGNAICAGSAAGLAAAFNSPLAGVTLVLEEIAGGRNEEKFGGRALLAAALAAVVIHFYSGDQAALPVTADLTPTTRSLWLAGAVALAAGLMGVAFQKSTFLLRAWMKQSTFPAWAKPAIGAGLASLFAVSAFFLTGNTGVFGLGETQLVAGINNQVIWGAALILAICKLLATALCYGSGGCGGIFAPILFFGGMTGAFLGGCLSAPLGLSEAERTLLCLVGITSCLSAVVRAPLTSILIVMEMTREILILPALMVAAVIGVYLNRLFFAQGFYDMALQQDGKSLD